MTSQPLIHDITASSTIDLCSTQGACASELAPSEAASNTQHSRSSFEGRIFTIDKDSTRWQILGHFSKVKLQQVFSPCEATQVFACKCLDHPWSAYGDSVVKVKFQVRASDSTILEYEDLIAECEESLRCHPRSQTTRTMLDAAHENLSLCTNATIDPNKDTLDELIALDRLGAQQCAHAPWHLGLSQYSMQTSLHKDAIGGGYVVFQLMTKLPGKRILHDEYWGLEVAEREKIRQAFKEALCAVWKCGVQPNDRALRNILWDAAERKCYIVDFEDCNINYEGASTQEWTDAQWEYWKLAESCFHGL